jgi:putative Holliday junction resolvase
MKILALDLGDRWIGTALSDASRIVARPYKTTELDVLIPFLTDLFARENISTVVVGKPQTFKGTESEQTKKIIAQKEKLEVVFPVHLWVFWEERLTSKHAKSMTNNKQKEELHSVAAALILDSYLSYLRFTQDMQDDTSNDDSNEDSLESL